jgi:hypothetical protein
MNSKIFFTAIISIYFVFVLVSAFPVYAGTAIQTNQKQTNTISESEPDNSDTDSFFSFTNHNDQLIFNNSMRQLIVGRKTFRFDTFGDTVFWGDTLKLHQAIAGEKLGGVGPGVSPKTALAVGLKVDVDALTPDLVRALKKGQVNLDAPASTQALLKANAVIGVKGVFNANGRMTSIGITCALCHSQVDNSLTSGIGHRLDGWANRDLNMGAIVNLSPDLSAVASLLQVDQATVRTVLNSWGAGKFDAELFMDGKAFRQDGRTSATLIPSIYGLSGVNMGTWTGFGSTTYWNAFVANLEMHGQGTFYDPRLKNEGRFPVAARAGFDNVRSDQDLITAKLGDLHAYQLAIPAPKPPSNSFDVAAAARGKTVFVNQGQCASCHVPPLFTEPGFNMHKPSEIGIDNFQANRSPTGQYRTSPLKGLWAHQKGGFYHDGRFATLADVVSHYDTTFKLGLSDGDKTDLVEYLKSL